MLIPINQVVLSSKVVLQLQAIRHAPPIPSDPEEPRALRQRLRWVETRGNRKRRYLHLLVLIAERYGKRSTTNGSAHLAVHRPSGTLALSIPSIEKIAAATGFPPGSSAVAALRHLSYRSGRRCDCRCQDETRDRSSPPVGRRISARDQPIELRL